MNSTPLTADLFISGVYEYREEAFDMQQLLSGTDLVGGVCPNPALPSVVSLDLHQPFAELFMYTNNLRDLAAPRELCVKKALELISSRANYELNLAAFRMDLLSEVLADVGEDDVDALIQGIRCICDHLLLNFDNYLVAEEEFFPYEFHTLHQDRYLFLSKIAFDANIPRDDNYIQARPVFRPATIAQPAYTYPEVQARNRASYFAAPDQCIIL